MSKYFTEMQLKKIKLYFIENGKCHICGKRVKFCDSIVEHIIPKVAISNWGIESSDDYWNLRIAHNICNIRRGAARIPGQFRLLNIEEVLMKCPECGSDKITKAGIAWSKRRKVQRFRCSDCGRLFVEPVIVKKDLS